MEKFKVGDKVRLKGIPPHVRNKTIGGKFITPDTILEVNKVLSHGDFEVACDWYTASGGIYTSFVLNDVIDGVISVDDDILLKDSCTCDLNAIMIRGCRCGYLEQRRKAGLE